MKKQVYLFIILGALLIGVLGGILLSKQSTPPDAVVKRPFQTPSPSLSPTPYVISPPEKKVLANTYHVFQTFNNCGPAALSMALSYYGISKTQQELGAELRPYQNPQGDNDDKSVTLAELASKAQEYTLITYHRPNGTKEMIKQFITLDIPVITRTLLHTTDDIGHFRVIKGYDESQQSFIQDDSLQGKNLSYTYTEFDQLWKQFGYEYVVLVPQNKKALVEQILGENLNEKNSWEIATQRAELQVKDNPSDIYAALNLSVAAYHTGEYEKSINAFESIEDQLPFRTLWYQIEPILAYYEQGRYDKVFTLTEKILHNQNRAFSELYFLQGEIYLKQGQQSQAKAAFEKAVFYNKNYKPAQEALNQIN